MKNKLIIIVTSLLLLPTWSVAQTLEPLNNIAVHSFGDMDLDDFDSRRSIVFDTNSAYKVEFCVTNHNMETRFLRVTTQHIYNGTKNTVSLYANGISSGCWSFGGNLETLVLVDYDRGRGMEFLITTQTTPSGTVNAESCELGEQGPFNCQPLS